MTDWLPALFETIDAMDPDAFVAFLTEDASFRFGSAPAVQGKAAVRDFIATFFGGLDGLSHTISESWDEGDTVLCEGEVTYRLPDGRRVALPFLNAFRMRGDLIADYRIYADPTPLAEDDG